jgi:hypothetical protein
LVDAGVDLAAVQAGVDSLGIGCKLAATEVKRHGFRALRVTVGHEPQHAHRHLHHITDMIDESRLSDRQKELARRIFTKLAEAEAKVHGTTIHKVHFHEVGAVDSIADIVGAAIGWDLLGAERLVVSPLPTGRGYVQIAHGRCSVPAPATAELLAGIPLAECAVEAELTTPTGAAIAATLADSFGGLPAMTISRIGYGAGARDLAEQPNVLRLLVGEAAGAPPADPPARDRVWVLETNLDDATGETIGYALERLWQAGALDVFTTAIQMKKNRPGVLLSAICPAEALAACERVLFAETTTLGVRRFSVERAKLPRSPRRVTTPWGVVDGVVATLEGGGARFSPEYKSCRRLAIEKGVSLRAVYDAARRAMEDQGVAPERSDKG